MLSGKNNPTLARDTMFAVIMIVPNGMVGLTLLMGALRHGGSVTISRAPTRICP
jgi:Ca2+:H+ antiporter